MNNMDFFDKESFYKSEEENDNISNVNDVPPVNHDPISSPNTLEHEIPFKTEEVKTEEVKSTLKDKLNMTIFDEKKFKKEPGVITKIFKVMSSAVLTVLLCIGAFLIFYVVTTKVAEKKGEYPPYGLFTIISPSMDPNIKVYDVVFIAKVKDYSKVKIGDVVTFYTGNSFFNGTPITHRIVQIYKTETGYKYITRGDNNPVEDNFDVTNENIAGKVVFKIPQLGRIQFFLASKGGWFIAILIPALAILGYDLVKVVKLLLLKKKLSAANHSDI